LTQGTGNGLLPRLSAQLVELATLQQSLYICLEHLDEPVEPLAAATEKGVGIAQVPAARGLLVHRVEVDRGRIRDYRILAPTEWNFHPRGVVARGLSTLSPVDTDTLERQARLFVTAVDPCVDYHLTID
jgi:coenzyme F420-reducing hydrogenase alpha subunit